MVKGLCSNEKIFPLAAVLSNYCFDCLAQSYLIVIESSCVDVFAVSHFQTLSKQIRQISLISDLVGPEADHVKGLFVRQNFCGRGFFLLLSFLLSHFETYSL